MTIESEIRQFIMDNLLYQKGSYPYPDATSFLDEGIIDSQGVLELVLFSEEAFKISVADEEIIPANFDSVSNIAGFVRRKIRTPVA